jgi:hypothetical protein
MIRVIIFGWFTLHTGKKRPSFSCFIVSAVSWQWLLEKVFRRGNLLPLALSSRDPQEDLTPSIPIFPPRFYEKDYRRFWSGIIEVH